MILLHRDLINQDFGVFLTVVASSFLALVVGITFHEFSHALVATSLGDELPRKQGRVTLNPLAHLEPAGAILMLVAGFGWGRPVQHDPYGLKISPKTATLLVAAAGPISNFLAAFVLALPIKLGWVPYINPLDNIPAFIFRREVQSPAEYAGLLLTGAMYLNVILGVFNLIPLPPLDGYNVALGVLPTGLSNSFAKLNKYGVGPLFLLLLGVPLLTGYNPFAQIMGPPVVKLVRFFSGVG